MDTKHFKISFVSGVIHHKRQTVIPKEDYFKRNTQPQLFDQPYFIPHSTSTIFAKLD